MDFDLPEEDVEFLERFGLAWETVMEGGMRMLILHDFPLPEPFDPSKVALHVRVPQNYDSGAVLDMFYTSPTVSRKDKKAIPAFTDAGMHAGRQWWQWSRHRSKDGNKWRPGEDRLDGDDEFELQEKSITHGYYTHRSQPGESKALKRFFAAGDRILRKS
ncbi:MAG: E2/UBC family protein [bacterium]|nr:E2/UBC family protein [bacterium]